MVIQTFSASVCRRSFHHEPPERTIVFPRTPTNWPAIGRGRGGKESVVSTGALSRVQWQGLSSGFFDSSFRLSIIYYLAKGGSVKIGNCEARWRPSSITVARPAESPCSRLIGSDSQTPARTLPVCRNCVLPRPTVLRVCASGRNAPACIRAVPLPVRTLCAPQPDRLKV